MRNHIKKPTKPVSRKCGSDFLSRSPAPPPPFLSEDCGHSAGLELCFTAWTNQELNLEKRNTERQKEEGLLDWIPSWWPSPFSSPPEYPGLIVSEGQQELLQCQSLPSFFSFRKLLILGGKGDFGIQSMNKLQIISSWPKNCFRNLSNLCQNTILRYG